MCRKVRKQPQKVWIIMHPELGFLPKYASVGFYASQGTAVSVAKLNPGAKVLCFTLDNPEVVYETPLEKEANGANQS